MILSFNLRDLHVTENQEYCDGGIGDWGQEMSLPRPKSRLTTLSQPRSQGLSSSRPKDSVSRKSQKLFGPENCDPLTLKGWSFTMILRYERAHLLQNFRQQTLLLCSYLSTSCCILTLYVTSSHLTNKQPWTIHAPRSLLMPQIEALSESTYSHDDF